jgi:hypothetical protein
MLRLMKQDPLTQVTLEVEPAHTGLTTDPLYGPEGSWAYYLSRGRAGLARALQTHFERPGTHVPDATRRRWQARHFTFLRWARRVLSAGGREGLRPPDLADV